MFDGALTADVVDVALSFEADCVEPDQENDIKLQREIANIIFIDGNIQISNSFGDHLDIASDVVKLDSTKDGIQQITDYVSGMRGVNCIHIVTHGTEGQVNIGSTVLNNENLSVYKTQLAKIGGVLSDDGDILLYGCRVAELSGREFVASLAEATGADVAASNNMTGDVGIGGDWLLEVESGPIEADTSLIRQYLGFSDLLTTPSVSDGGRTGYVKDAEAVKAAPGMNITNGGDYGGGGSLSVVITSVDTSETLSLEKVGSASTSNNIVSVVGSTLYLGSGSGFNVIGSIDSTNNGINGNSLQINFLSDSFTNASFESGDLTGWTADISNQIDLGTTSIAGIATPADGSDPPNSGGDSDVPSRKGTWTAPVNTVDKSHGIYSLQLKSASMTTANGYDVVHGPSVYSDIFSGENGQTISFDWRALGGGDAYDVFGYIVNTSTNATTEILNATGTSAAGTTAWATANVTIPITGNYRFVFVSGTYDFTGGKLAGASLYIDNIQVFNAVDDAIVSQVAKLITYETVDTTLTDAERTARTLTFTATDADGNAANNTAIIFEDFPKAELPPPQRLSVANTVAEINLPSSVIKINRDGLQTFVRDKNVAVVTSNQMESSFSGMDSEAIDPAPTQQNSSSKSETSVPVTSNFNSTSMPLFNSPNPNDGGVSVLNGIENLEIESLGRISYTIPVDAFAKSNNDTMVSLKASQSGDRALPSWLKFDPVAGKFEGEVPEDFEGFIEVVVTATDQNGNEVTTSFVIKKDISNSAVNSEEQSQFSPTDINEQLAAVHKQAFTLGGFSQQILLSSFSKNLLSESELKFAIQEIKTIS
jgi:hypothetical protein